MTHNNRKVTNYYVEEAVRHRLKLPSPDIF